MALEHLREHSVTFPNILDVSTEAHRVVFEDYQTGDRTAVPMSYLIGRDGVIIDRWYGFSDSDPQPYEALKKAGIDVRGEGPKPPAAETPDAR